MFWGGRVHGVNMFYYLIKAAGLCLICGPDLGLLAEKGVYCFDCWEHRSEMAQRRKRDA